MSYATQRDAFARTLQDLLVVGVRECQNHYASRIDQLLTYTQDMSNAAWVKTSVSVTSNNAEAPDRTQTADTVAFNALNDAIAQDGGVVCTSKAFTGDLFAQVPSGTKLATLRVRNAAGTQLGSRQITITTDWTRFFVHKLFTGVPVDNVWIELIRLGGDDVTDVRLWGWNLSRNPGDRDREMPFPYIIRTAEAVGTLATQVSRCSITDNGDGARCFMSAPTCQSLDDFNSGNVYENATTPNLRGIREFRFCRKDAPLPLAGETVLPMLVSLPIAAQEIDAERGVTFNERVSFQFEDDAGPGLWNPRQANDGALVNTQAGAGTFLRRWLAIYKNYGNPECYAIRKTGFVEAGGTEADFQTRGRYLMSNVVLNADRSMTLVCTDRLKLTRKKIPSKVSDDNTIQLLVDTFQTTIRVLHPEEITPPAANASAASPDYIVTLELEPDTASAEKVNVLSIDLDTGDVEVQRARWGTTGKAHAVGAAFREVAEFGTERANPSGVPLGKNPIDIEIELHRYAGLASEDIDIARLQSERDTWLYSSVDTVTADEYGALFRRTVTDPTDVETLSREIRELVLLFLWTDASLRLTGRLYAPPLPTETLTVLSDDGNLLAGSISVEDNTNETRITRTLVAWSPIDGEDDDTAEGYAETRIDISLDEEERAWYGEARTRILLSKWIRASDRHTAEYFASHVRARFLHGVRTFRANLEIRDDAVDVGQCVQVQSAFLQDQHGNDWTSEMMVVKKRQVGDGKISIEALDMGIFGRYWFYADAGAADYGSASDDEKRRGYLSDPQGFVGTPREPGYKAW